MGGARWRGKSGDDPGKISVGVGEIGKASRRLIEGQRKERNRGSKWRRITSKISCRTAELRVRIRSLKSVDMPIASISKPWL
jgi:hypothetical protein